MRTRTYILPYLLYIALHTTSFVNHIQSSRTSYLDSRTVILREALHEALHKALHTEAARGSARSSTYGSSARGLCPKALRRVPAIFPIASTRASAKYTPYIATLIFTFPSFLTSSLPREAPERQPAEDRRQN